MTPARLREWMGIDGYRWASAFVAKLGNQYLRLDVGILHTWFANAIEAGRDDGVQTGRDQGLRDAHAADPCYDDGETNEMTSYSKRAQLLCEECGKFLDRERAPLLPEIVGPDQCKTCGEKLSWSK